MSLAPLAHDDWRQDVKSILSDSFEKQLREIRQMGEGIRHDTKEEVRRLLQCSTVPKQEPPVLTGPGIPMGLRESGTLRIAAPPKPCVAFVDCNIDEETLEAVPAIKHNGFYANRAGMIDTKSSKSLLFLEPSMVGIPGGVDDSEEAAHMRERSTNSMDDSKKVSWDTIQHLDSRKSEATNTQIESLRTSHVEPNWSMHNRRSSGDTQATGRFSGRSSLRSSDKPRPEPSNTVSGFEASRRGRILKNAIVSMEFPPSPQKKMSRLSSHAMEGTTCWPFFAGAEAVVNSIFFDYVMGMLLLVNAIVLGVSVDTIARASPDEAPDQIFEVLDWTFNVIFTIELIMRILAFRENFLHTEGWRWNAFDAFMVTGGWIYALTFKLAGSWIQNSELASVNVGWIRLLKMGRLLRLVRMVRLIPELKSMVYLMIASMSSFLWALVLMLIVVYIMAVYFTELASEQRGSPNPEMVELWGSLWRSVLSLYMGVTGGEDWVVLVTPFKATNSNVFISATLVFSVYIAFATLVMLNLVTGVFVESAQRIIKEEKENEIMNMAAKLFIESDDDHSQDITLEEWTEQLNQGNLDEYIRAVGINRSEAGRLFELLDLDESGTINVVEFVQGCVRLRGPAKALDMADSLMSVKKQGAETMDRILALQATFDDLVDSKWQRRPR